MVKGSTSPFSLFSCLPGIRCNRSQAKLRPPMSYAHPRSQNRRLTGLVVTVALQMVLIYALIHGLARKIVEIVTPPLETKIIEEIKPPQPDKPPPAPAPFVPTPAPQPVRTAPVVQAASCDKPEYPPASRRANETGTVLLNFLIDEKGKVLDSKIERSSGSRRLDDAARAGLELCKFQPATVDGRATRAWARIEYVWRLE